MKCQRNPEFDEILPELAEAVPALRGLRLEQIATPLGGLSNSSYRLDLPDGALVLRVPRSNPGPFRFDRQEEVEAACFAGMVGIGPPVLYANPQGVMLTRFIEEAQPMSIEAYRSDPGSVQRTAHIVARLHRSDHRFKRLFEDLLQTCFLPINCNRVPKVRAWKIKHLRSRPQRQNGT